MIINVLSNPRNISTALMYSFSQRKDLTVIDEPFYAYYLKKSRKFHPGKDEILHSQAHESEEVIRLIKGGSKHIFVKNMAHHLIKMDWDFMLEWKNVFLIRNPYQMISSFAKVIESPSHEDIGYKIQFEIYQFLKTKGAEIHFIDSGEILKDPPSVLHTLCAKLDLPFDENMLHWKAGAIPEDGVWAKYWYKNVHQSTGFSKQKTSGRKLPEHLRDLYNESEYIYNQFYTQAIKA